MEPLMHKIDKLVLSVIQTCWFCMKTRWACLEGLLMQSSDNKIIQEHVDQLCF